MEENKQNVIKVDFGTLRKLPNWFIKTLPWKMYYHEECLKDFELIEDEERFAGGCAFFCKHCGTQCYTRLDAADAHKAFVVTVIHCHLGCGAIYKIKNIEPIWVRVLEDWDNEDYKDWKEGVVKNGRIKG